MGPEPVVTTPDFTDAERAAWEVAVERGLPIEAADLRAMLEAAAPLLAEAWGVKRGASALPEGFAASNAARTRAAGHRDAGSATMILAQHGDKVSARQRLVAEAKIASPEASWTQIGAKVGMTKDQAAGLFRRMLVTAGRQMQKDQMPEDGGIVRRPRRPPESVTAALRALAASPAGLATPDVSAAARKIASDGFNLLRNQEIRGRVIRVSNTGPGPVAHIWQITDEGRCFLNEAEEEP